MTLDELCKEANRMLKAQKISVSDGRTAATVTPRNVRYYRTLGLLSPPGRVEGRADYEKVHLEEIVEIKRAQAGGMSLEELRARRGQSGPSSSIEFMKTSMEFASRTLMPSDDDLPMALSFLRSTSSSPLSSLRYQLRQSRPTNREVGLGWSVRVGDVTISGQADPPDPDKLEAIIAILRKADTAETHSSPEA